MRDGVKFHDRLYARFLLPLVPASVLPNHLTMFRMIFTPAVVVLAVMQWYVWSLIVFLILAFSDTLDGSLARVRGQVTTWGKVFDPVADKILVGSLVIVLVMQHLGPGLALLILGLELTFLLIGWWKIKQGKVVQANRWGKIKMFLQVIGVSLLLLGLITGFQGLFHISSQTLYLALVFALVSLLAAGF